MKFFGCRGGASLQFSMVPQNLLPHDSGADFIETGSWSTKAITECNKIGHANIIASSKKVIFLIYPLISNKIMMQFIPI